MRAMVLKAIKSPLQLEDVPIPQPSPEELLIRVSTCGVCRTDLHIIDGELPHPSLPLILGHQIVGEVVEIGSAVSRFKIGMRVGVPWLGKTCGNCFYCLEGKENLCDKAVFTGYTRNGGFAEYCTAHASFVFPLPSSDSDSTIAPWLCPGFIGYRALRLTEGAENIGFYGFGVAAHILAQVIAHQGGKVFAFTRPNDREGQQFAKQCGAVWAGDTTESPPEPLDAAIIFAPVGDFYPLALKAVRKGGIVVSAGIHMSDIPSFPYRLLWEERMMRSVANLTRQDGEDFLRMAPQIPLKTTVNIYPLEKANEALEDQRQGRIKGAAVIKIEGSS